MKSTKSKTRIGAMMSLTTFFSFIPLIILLLNSCFVSDAFSPTPKEKRKSCLATSLLFKVSFSSPKKAGPTDAEVLSLYLSCVNTPSK